MASIQRSTLFIHPSTQYGFGKKISFEIPKVSDVLANMQLYVQLPPLVPITEINKASDPRGYVSWTNALGHAMFETKIDFYLDNILEESVYPMFQEMFSTIDDTAANSSVSRLQSYSGAPLLSEAQELIVPLSFWFTRTKAMMNKLKLIMLNDSSVVRIEFTLRPFDDLVHYTSVKPEPVTITSMGLMLEYYRFVNYDYDKDDAQWKMLYNPASNPTVFEFDVFPYTGTSRLFQWKVPYMERPIAKLVFAFRETSSVLSNNHFYFGTETGDPIVTSITVLKEGVEMFASAPEICFRAKQGYNRFIYVVPFVIKGTSQGAVLTAEKSLVLKAIMNSRASSGYLHIYAILL